MTSMDSKTDDVVERNRRMSGYNSLHEEYCADLRDPKMFVQIVEKAFDASMYHGYPHDWGREPDTAGAGEDTPGIKKEALKDLLADPQIASDAKKAAKLLYDNYSLFSNLRYGPVNQSDDHGITEKDLNKLVSLSSGDVKGNYYVQKQVLDEALKGAAAGGVLAAGSMASFYPPLIPEAAGFNATLFATLFGYNAYEQAKVDQQNRLSLESLHFFHMK